MHRVTTTIRSALIAAGFAAMPALLSTSARAQINDAIRGAPEANHFIATPGGWTHPTTPWGEPDLQATLDMMQASRVPLERCADSYRPGAPACDMDQEWVPEEEYNARREAYDNRVDRMAQLLAEGDIGAAFGAAEPNRIPQRQTNLIVDPPNGLLPSLTPEAKRRALINLAVQGSPPGNRFPASDQMKTTERIVRLNDDVWRYEITTEDSVILTEPFTVRYPMRHDPDYEFPEYACHEGNTIVRNYVETNRYERANPKQQPPQPSVEVVSSVADALAGRWVGRPRIPTIDVDIELAFTKNPDGTVNGKLIGTTLGEIDKPLRELRIEGHQLDFTLPNIDPWNMSLTLTGHAGRGRLQHPGHDAVTFRRIGS